MKNLSHRESKVVKKLHPGSPGTLKHLRKWGDALVCVRHRHDPQDSTRYTTVEIVVEHVPMQLNTKRHISVRLDPHDKATRSLVLAAGGRWNATTRLWRVPRQLAEALGLQGEALKVGTKRSA